MAAANANLESPPPAHAPPPVRRGFARWLILAVILVVLVGIAIGISLQRKPIAAFLVQAYLLRHGVTSTVEFDRLARGGFLARIKLGPESPEFTAEILDVTLDYDGFFVLPRIGTVRLVRPILRATYDGKQFRLGSLQRLVDEALAKEPEGPGPSVTIDEGTLIVSTPAGPLQFTVNAVVNQGRLDHFDSRLRPTKLQSTLYDADIAEGMFAAKISGNALNGSIALTLNSAALKGNRPLESRQIVVTAELGGIEWRRAKDKLDFKAATAAIAIRSGAAQSAQLSLAQSDTRLVLQDLQGNFANGRLQANAQTDVHSDLVELHAGGTTAAKLSLQTSFAPASFAFSVGEWSARGPVRLVADGTEIRQGPANGGIAIRSVRAELNGTGGVTNTGMDGTLEGSVVATATLSRRVATDFVHTLPVIGTDPALSESLIEAMTNAGLRMPQLRVAHSTAETTIALLRPAVLSGRGEARMDLLPERTRPFLRLRDNSVDGGVRLHLRGGALPDLQIAIPSYRMTVETKGLAFDASTQFDARLNLASLHGVHVMGNGTVDSRDGRIRFVLTRCADVSFDSFIGNNAAQLTNTKAQLCGEPANPLLVSDKNGWRFAGALNDVATRIEQAQTSLSNGKGRIELAGDNTALRTGRMELTQANLSDTLPAARFRPIAVSGAANLSGQEWQSRFDLTARDRRVASVEVRHVMETGSGSAIIDAQNLAFDPATLQPGDISPLLAGLASRVRGRTDFTGRVDWTPKEMESSGRVHLMDVDFQSRLGQVRRASGDLALSSLIPFTLAPDQTMTMDRIEWLVPLEQATARFTLSPTEMQLHAATANVAGGRVSLDPESFSFMPASTTKGTLRLEHVDLTPLLAAASLADRVKVAARIQGVVPFTFGPDGLRFSDGRIAAEGPGRLSIRRDALTAAIGTGAGGAAPPSAVQDFAYQALENLAFDQLTGDVNSLPKGRLGVLLHVKGVNDPAQAMETRVAVEDLLRGRAFDKPLPLPKGTPIDLTLDTSLNLDELLQSYFGSSSGAPASAP